MCLSATTAEQERNTTTTTTTPTTSVAESNVFEVLWQLALG